MKLDKEQVICESSLGQKIDGKPQDTCENSIEKEEKDYTDKSVTECDLPEIIVCYKENTCQVVKDICVDEGVYSQDKFLFDNGNMVQKLILPSQTRQDLLVNDVVDAGKFLTGKNSKYLKDSEVSKEAFVLQNPLSVPGSEEERYKQPNPHTGQQDEGKTYPILKISMLDVSKSSTENFYGGLQFDSKDIIAKKEVNEDAKINNSDNDSSDNDASNERFTLGAILSFPQPDMEPTDHQKHSQSLSGEEASGNGEFGESNNLSKNLEAEKSNNNTDESNPKLDCTENTNLLLPSTTHEESTDRNLGTAVSDSSWNHYNHHRKLEDLYDQDVSSQIEKNVFESSFSMAGPHSGPIVSYSGSISHRSDSSTTSTRSFAFPVMQSEWHSSPVRMANAERRHFRRGWRDAILCCRF